LIHFYKRFTYTMTTTDTKFQIDEIEPPQIEDILDDDDYSGMPDLDDNPAEPGSTAAASPNADKAPREEAESPRAKVGEWEDILGSGRLRKKTLVEGTGERPERGSRVSIKLTESLQPDTDIVKEDEELEFNAGESEVLQALDLIVPLMYVGETALVESGSDFCYGGQGDGTRIPGSAQIYLRVELVSCQDLPAIPDIPLTERARIGNEKRLRGNNWYTRAEYSQAVQCYRKAVEYLDDESIDNEVEVPIDRFLLPREVQDLLENRVKAYNNMAQAQMKLTAWDSALASIKQVLKVEPNNEKALFRKSKVLQEKCRVEEAVGILRRVTRLYPSNKPAQVELSALLAKQRKGREKEQAMSRKMLGITPGAPVKTETGSGRFSKQTKLMVACIGGLGAILGAIVARTYNFA